MKDYQKETIETYDNHADDFQRTRARFTQLERIADFLGYVSGKDILDVGCGPGRDLCTFVDRGYTVTGIDLSAGLLEKARDAVPQASIHQMDATKLDFDDDSFDAIWASAVYLHLKPEDAAQALHEAYRVLRPDGIIRCSVKKGDGEQHRQDALMGNASRFFYLYQPDEFRKLVESAGFTVVDFNENIHDTGHRKDPWIDIIAKK